jgi:hypothetical protein
LKIKAQIVFRNVIQDLKDAVNDWITNDGGDPTGIWIISLSGVAYDLSNISVPLDVDINGIRIYVGSLHIDIPTIALVGLNPVLLPTIVLMGLNIDLHIPGSENWYYGGPLREDVWPPKIGTDPVFASTQYYTFDDGAIDQAGFAFAIGLIYGLNKAGLSSVATYFVRRLFSHGTISQASDVESILSNSLDIISTVNTINTSLGSSSPSVSSVVSSIKVVVEAMKTVIDEVKIELLSTTSDPQTVIEKLNSIMIEIGDAVSDPETLDQKISDIKTKLGASVYF